jgi:ribonuclease HI
MSSDILSGEALWAAYVSGQSKRPAPVQRRKVQSTALHNTSSASPFLSSVEMWTDGGCSPNPGLGGWAVILRANGGQEREFSGAEPDTTNNRMELMAAIQGLERLTRPCLVTIHTDSEYLERGVSSRLPGWIAAGWRTASKKLVLNRDLWERLIEAMRPHQVVIRWTKGHATDAMNIRADRLVSTARFHASRNV